MRMRFVSIWFVGIFVKFGGEEGWGYVSWFCCEVLEFDDWVSFVFDMCCGYVSVFIIYEIMGMGESLNCL